jgi:AraC-like DNA-binding protein
MHDPVIIGITAATLGQILLASLLLMQRYEVGHAHHVLAALLMAVGLVVAPPMVAAVMPMLASIAIALSLPAALACAPLLWFFSCALTSEQPWRLERRALWHLLLPASGLVIALTAIALPRALRETLLLRGELVDSMPVLALVLVAFVLILGWTVQTAIYLFLIIRRLARYRRRLKDLFASNDTRELRWLSGFVLVVGTVWLLSVASLMFDNLAGLALLSGRAGALLGFALVGFLALWGLRQQPGFAGRYLPAPSPDEQPTPPTAKYQRSALDAGRAARIAAKLAQAMREDRPYLEPELSLFELARRIGVPSNYLSQTLNEHIGENFFDYINRWRVEAALPLLRAGERSVLEIALEVGFNSRSTFYKAFRKVTGHAPGAYRAAE